MTTNDDENDSNDIMAKIFLPHYFSEKDRILKTSNLFAHYTSAATLISIVRNNEWWMRTAAVMNDFSEIDYGRELFLKCLQEHKTTIDSSLKSMDKNFSSLAGEKLEEYLRIAKFESYVASFTEHNPEIDHIGKLSMWRAYGGSNGAAILLEKEPFFPQSAHASVLMCPVNYFDQAGFDEMFLGISESIATHKDILSQKDVDLIADFWAKTLVIIFLTTKHPGFSEEKEWRLLFLPTLRNTESEHVTLRVESVENTPQKVAIFPLKNNLRLELKGISPPELIRGVILGPSAFPVTTAMAVDFEMQKSGFADVGNRITISPIPLRS